MNYLWILAGIVFIVYKLTKESRSFHQIGKPKMDLKQQAAFNREKELSMMSNEQIGELIGVPYKLLPNNNEIVGTSALIAFGYGHTLKRRCLESIIMRKEGLVWYKFISKGYDVYIPVQDYSLNGNYGIELEKFINNYSSEHQ